MKTAVHFFSLLALLLATACGGEIEPGRTEGEPPVVRGLGLMTLSATSLAEGDSYVGTVESPDRGVLAARIDGRVTRVAVREGDRVKAGDLLVTIEDNTAADRVAEAEAGLAEAKAALAAAEARLALAEKTFDRYQQLFAREAVTPQEFDRVSAERETARRSVDSARAAARRAASGRDAARTSLAYTRVTAPYQGRVVRRQVEEGSTVLPGTPLLTLDRAGAWRVRADLPESLAGQVNRGDLFHVEIPALARTLSGSVQEILSAADPQSRSFQIKITLESSQDLTAGLFARVRAAGRDQALLLVPSAAVVTRGQLTGVYVVEAGILHFRLVKTGRRLGDRVEILSGLSEGETLVVEGAGRAKNGARVEG